MLKFCGCPIWMTPLIVYSKGMSLTTLHVSHLYNSGFIVISDNPVYEIFDPKTTEIIWFFTAEERNHTIKNYCMNFKFNRSTNGVGLRPSTNAYDINRYLQHVLYRMLYSELYYSLYNRSVHYYIDYP